MERQVLIAPSILSADFSKLGEEIRDVEASGGDVIHVDVMDGHFVPNLTVGPPVIASLRQITTQPLDVHLMIENPGRFVEQYAKAGANWLTIHVEAAPDVAGTLSSIRRLGLKAGISLRPGTPVEVLKPFLPLLDLVLVMTVEPGFGGQAFIAGMAEKVRTLRHWGFAGDVSVDGGISDASAGVCAAAGANVFVAGTFIFGKRDRKQAVSHLRQAALKSYGFK